MPVRHAYETMLCIQTKKPSSTVYVCFPILMMDDVNQKIKAYISSKLVVYSNIHTISYMDDTTITQQQRSTTRNYTSHSLCSFNINTKINVPKICIYENVMSDKRPHDTSCNSKHDN